VSAPPGHALIAHPPLRPLVVVIKGYPLGAPFRPLYGQSTCQAHAKKPAPARWSFTRRSLGVAGLVTRGYRVGMPSRLRRRTALFALVRAFKPGTPGIGKRLSALPRMIKASMRGEYDAGARLLLMAAASLYILSPLDAIPELFTAFIGLIDDAFVATWLAGALLDETERFLEWERITKGPPVVPGQVVHG
jgi:hypothetical protein